jgi:hypothetical protein
MDGRELGTGERPILGISHDVSHHADLDRLACLTDRVAAFGFLSRAGVQAR